MKTIKVIKLEANDKPFLMGLGKDAKQATTIVLLRNVLNNPQNGKSPQGEDIFRYDNVDDMRIGMRVLEKMDEAEKAAGKGTPESFELEDSEFDVCKKYVTKYESYLSTPFMLPFLEQFDGND